MNKTQSLTSRRMDVGTLLDSFIWSGRYVPPGARRIRSQDELPLPLQSHAQQFYNVVWRAWDDGQHIWFVKAKVASCESGAGLRVMFLNMDGHLIRSGLWVWLKHQGWVLSDPTDAVSACS
jgi:hypothetical protein